MVVPFLTSLAPGATVAGSRDPLGFQAVWSRMGRRLIHNVTTVSGDLRGWTTLLVGTHVAWSFIEDGSCAEDRFTDLFVRFEQIVAYSRDKLDPSAREGVRGINGVHRRLNQHTARKLILGEGPEAKVLDNQRATGVLGQISTPARLSLLLEESEVKLRAEIRDRVQALYGPALAPHRSALHKLLVDRALFDRDGVHAGLVAALAQMHASTLTTAERDFYRRFVLQAGKGEDDIQARLVKCWPNLRVAVDATSVAVMAEAGHSPQWSNDIADRLGEILRAESLLAPAEHLFGFLLGRHQQLLSEVAAEIGNSWPALDVADDAVDLVVRYLREAYRQDPPTDTLAAIATAFRAGAWQDAIQAVRALNTWVAQRRGGDSWISVQQDRLDVRFQEESSDLPDDPAALRWMHSFYLDPLRRLALAVDGGAR